MKNEVVSVPRENPAAHVKQLQNQSESESGRERTGDCYKKLLGRFDSSHREWRSYRRRNPHEKETSLKTVRTVNARYHEALKPLNYGLTDSSSTYNKNVLESVAKWTNRLEIHMMLNTSDAFHYISITSF